MKQETEEQRAKRLEYARNWKRANREKHRLYQREYVKANPDKKC